MGDDAFIPSVTFIPHNFVGLYKGEDNMVYKKITGSHRPFHWNRVCLTCFTLSMILREHRSTRKFLFRFV